MSAATSSHSAEKPPTIDVDEHGNQRPWNDLSYLPFVWETEPIRNVKDKPSKATLEDLSEKNQRTDLGASDTEVASDAESSTSPAESDTESTSVVIRNQYAREKQELANTVLTRYKTSTAVVPIVHLHPE